MSVDQELTWEALGAKSYVFIFLSSGHSIWKLLSVCQIFVILCWLNRQWGNVVESVSADYVGKGWMFVQDQK